MKTIEINRGGFGLASLFNPDKTTNDVLVGQDDLKGVFLEEIGIVLKKGKIYKYKSPLRNNIKGYKIHKIRVYNITDKLYECEFVD